MNITLTYADDGRLIVEATGETVACHWFSRCVNPATALEPHPVLGPLPICQRCKDVIA